MKITEILLKRYKESSFVIQLKARFLLFIYVILFFLVAIIIFYTTNLQLNNPAFGYSVDIKLFGIAAGLLVLLIGFAAILVRGYFALAAHCTLIILFMAIWFGMIIDRSETVSRIDTIVLILAVISSIPFFITRSRIAILIYSGVNLMVFYVFMFYFRSDLNLSAAVFPEFIADNTIAFLFIGIISYNLFSINRRALDKAENDIADREKAEKALKESEQKLRAIFDTSFGFIGLLTPEGIIIEANQTALDLSGAQLSDVLGKPFWETHWWSHSAELQEQLRAAVRDAAAGNFIRFETIHPDIDGSHRTIDFSLKPVKDDAGKVILLIPEGRDITERKQSEEALQAAMEELQATMEELETSSRELEESEMQYRFISENTADVIWALSLKTGKFTYVSPSVYKMRGFTPEEVMNQTLQDVLTPDSIEIAVQKMQNGITKKKGNPKLYNYVIQVNQICKDGSVIPTEVASTLVFDENDQPMEIIGISRDITERKKAEEQNRILEERLQQADKMESIGRLAGGIAHDFNNLLMGIQGYASLTKMNIDKSHPYYEMLQLIEDQVQSGADLTKQLLSFARGGRYEIKPTDLNEIIKKTSSMFSRTKKEISIELKGCKDLWSVEVDRSQIEQVFVNLFVNAWQAMPGGGRIYLETENILLNDESALINSVNPGKYVKINVSDTGTGMDEKTMEHIFDPFFTTKEMGRGTGLGLATVNGIIKGHKGIINVYSKPAKGTTFTIYLPASEKEVVNEKIQTKEIIKGTETILLVDDEKMVLGVNRKLLESIGYKVYTAGSGLEAVSIYMEKQNEIDLIILDMIMPGLSGAELIDRLIEINFSIKILLTSGYSIDGEAQKTMERGCSGFLQKPFQIEQLSCKVREMLD